MKKRILLFGTPISILISLAILSYNNRICYSEMRYVSDSDYLNYANSIFASGETDGPTSHRYRISGNIYSSPFGFMSAPVNGKEIEVSGDSLQPKIYFSVISPCGSVLSSTR